MAYNWTFTKDALPEESSKWLLLLYDGAPCIYGTGVYLDGAFMAPYGLDCTYRTPDAWCEISAPDEEAESYENS